MLDGSNDADSHKDVPFGVLLIWPTVDSHHFKNEKSLFTLLNFLKMYNEKYRTW